MLANIWNPKSVFSNCPQGLRSFFVLLCFCAECVVRSVCARWGVNHCGNHLMAEITERWLLREPLQETKRPQREKRKWFLSVFNKTLALWRLSAQFHTVRLRFLCVSIISHYMSFITNMAPVGTTAQDNRYSCLGLFYLFIFLNNQQHFGVLQQETLCAPHHTYHCWVMWRNINNFPVRNARNVNEFQRFLP